RSAWRGVGAWLKRKVRVEFIPRLAGIVPATRRRRSSVARQLRRHGKGHVLVPFLALAQPGGQPEVFAVHVNGTFVVGVPVLVLIKVLEQNAPVAVVVLGHAAILSGTYVETISASPHTSRRTSSAMPG